MLKRPDFMPVLLLLRRFFHEKPAVWRKGKSIMTLLEAEVGKTYIIKEINTDDDEMNSFLFRLGCYSGEPITVVSKSGDYLNAAVSTRKRVRSILSKLFLRPN